MHNMNYKCNITAFRNGSINLYIEFYDNIGGILKDSNIAHTLQHITHIQHELVVTPRTHAATRWSTRHKLKVQVTVTAHLHLGPHETTHSLQQSATHCTHKLRDMYRTSTIHHEDVQGGSGR